LEADSGNEENENVEETEEDKTETPNADQLVIQQVAQAPPPI
jgi:hypothetical protein